MKLLSAIKLRIGSIIVLNILMTFVCIWGFSRMNMPLKKAESKCDVIANSLNKLEDSLKQADSGNFEAEQIRLLQEAITASEEIQTSLVDTADAMKRQRASNEWCIVLMSIVAFVMWLSFFKAINKLLITPISTIGAVLEAFRMGETKRRFTLSGNNRDIRKIYEELNHLLDRQR